jgi:hypothetical protein
MRALVRAFPHRISLAELAKASGVLWANKSIGSMKKRHPLLDRIIVTPGKKTSHDWTKGYCLRPVEELTQTAGPTSSESPPIPT